VPPRVPEGCSERFTCPAPKLRRVVQVRMVTTTPKWPLLAVVSKVTTSLSPFSNCLEEKHPSTILYLLKPPKELNASLVLEQCYAHIPFLLRPTKTRALAPVIQKYGFWL